MNADIDVSRTEIPRIKTSRFVAIYRSTQKAYIIDPILVSTTGAILFLFAKDTTRPANRLLTSSVQV